MGTGYAEWRGWGYCGKVREEFLRKHMRSIHRRLLLRGLALLGCGVAGGVSGEEAAGAKGRLQVYVLAGQSNMQGHAQVRTFEHIGMDPATVPMLAKMTGADGKPKVCERVWIASLGSADEERTGKLTAGFGVGQGGPKIGPEFTFGLYMEELTEAPILLIKTAWGGKSLNTDFRPPGSGPYPFSEAQLEGFRKAGKDVEAMRAAKAAETGVNYRLMVEYVRKVVGDIGKVVPGYDASLGYDLAGFVWFQGWNDMVDSGTYPRRDEPGGYDAYGTVLAQFIRDVRKDLEAPRLPFVIGVMGIGGPTSEYGAERARHKGVHQHFRDAMAAPAGLPEFAGSVAAVRTEVYWDKELSTAKAKEQMVRGEAKRRGAAGEKVDVEALLKEKLSERERAILEKGISNLEFHYLGSAKILGGVGKGLAEAMVGLRRGGEGK